MLLMTPVAEFTGAPVVFVRRHAVLYTDNHRVLWYHKSFPDFLFNEARSKGFWCNEAEHHQDLIMKAGLFFNRYWE
jgi:hypothetical protein